MDRDRWPELKAHIAAVFLQRGRDDWAGRFAGTDACVAPVLSLDEAVAHPHQQHRASHREWRAGGRHPAAAPRFSRTAAVAADDIADAAVAAAVRTAWDLPSEEPVDTA
jgi:alpha-methylacyl-CoA racemase